MKAASPWVLALSNKVRSLVNVSRLVRTVRAFSREFRQPREFGDLRQEVLPQRRLTLGVALGGGFARGIAHVGVLKVLEEENIPVDYVAGTSVGAIIGAAYCSGMTAAELEEAAFAVRFRDFGRLTLSRYGFYNSDRMVRLFARVLKCHTFEELKIPLAIAATEFRTGEAVVFTKGPLADPIRASCAYPGMFLPVNIRGRWLVDGMLAHAVPSRPLLDMGAKKVLAVHLKGRWSHGTAPRHLFDVIGQCFAIAQDMSSTQWKQAADLIIEPDVNGYDYDAFVHTGALIKAGEIAMREAIPTLRKWVEARQPLANVRAARALVQAATMPAD